MSTTEQSLAQGAGIYNVRNYGAAGDGVTLDTLALNQAIQACARSGGGTVYIPAGTYLTGTLTLSSNMTLWIGAGATLLGSKNLADYPAPESWAKRDVDFGYGIIRGEHWYKTLIWGENLEAISILGPGKINGNRVTNPQGEESLRGPHALSLQGCRDIIVRDLTIIDASNWALRLGACERVNIDGYTAIGGWDGINLAGGAKDVTIANCHVYSGDDAFAGGPVNMTMTNCVLSSSANGFRYWGENAIISNVVIIGPCQSEHRTSHKHNTEAGVQGCPTGNFVMSNVTMVNIRSPFWLDYTGNERGRAKRANLILNNITATGLGTAPLVVLADPGSPVRSLVLNDVRFTYTGGAQLEDTCGQSLCPYSILPWYGLYAQAVENLELHNVRFWNEQKDLRPALLVEQAGTLELDRFFAQREAGGAPSVEVIKAQRMLVDGQERAVTSLRVHSLAVSPRPILMGEPFVVTAGVENPGPEGLGEVSLQIGKLTLAKSFWLKAGETAAVSFANVVVQEHGDLTVQAGPVAKSMHVAAKPAGTAVAAPYLAFDNTHGDVLALENGAFYVRSTDNPSEATLERADTYAVAYRKAALPANGAVIVRMENPDLRSGWAGQVGIMVRNDMAQAGQSAGYLALTASPETGYFLQWDAQGNGRIDQFTELDGYTYWPGWLKLERQGSRFSGYFSKDGVTWNKVGEAQAVGANEKLDAGMFAHWGSARFSEFKVIG